ncbi:MAG: glycoside hydrolase family 16 protein [Pseudobdellovibrio sp.]
MKFLALLILLGFSFHLEAAPPSDYKLVWEDNFDGTSLDLTKWKENTNTRDQAVQTGDASTVKNGVLTIKAYTKDNVNYTSFLTTNGLYKAAFGYYEAKIKFRSAPGEWCAFWLQSMTIGNPLHDPANAGVEIDIAEHRLVNGKMQDVSNIVGHNLHWDGYKQDHKHLGSVGAPLAGAPPLQGNWHTYALLWTKTAYTFYIDDVAQWTTNTPISQIPEEIRLTCEVKDNDWAGIIPAAGYGPLNMNADQTGMDVDYVRVYQQP